MNGAIVPPPANPEENLNGNANQHDQDDDNDDNNVPAGPTNAPPNQPPNQPPPNQPALQLPPNQPAPANPTGPPQPVPNWSQPFPCQPAPQIIHQQMVNWSIFKPEFAAKPEEDAEAHLLHKNDWMQMHHFEEKVKVDRFCLTLLGEARLWYETLNLNHIDWLEL